MYTLTNDIKKKLAKTVDILPTIFVVKNEKVQAEGEWLALSPLAEKPYNNGRELVYPKFEKGKKYWYNAPVLIAVNHHRRLRKIYQKMGIEGVRMYCNRITELANAQ